MSAAPSFGVAMLGYAFMGRAHSRALRALRELGSRQSVTMPAQPCGFNYRFVPAVRLAREIVPPGHIVGWGDTFTHEPYHLLAAVKGTDTVTPHGATFEDGYRCAEVCNAIQRSTASGRKERIDYR